MPQLETTRLDQLGVARKQNEPMTIWYGLPILQFPDVAPFIPLASGYPGALELLQGILRNPDFVNNDSGPPLVVLPELAIPFTQIVAARELIASAPRGTVFVFGIGQMTEAEALSLENRPDLWDGACAGRFANCAAVAVGGTDRIFLQPKLLRSSFEQDTHWPGRVVRCFTGTYLRFATFICSDLLNRPGATSNLAWLHDELEREQQKLTFAVWLQHNEKPRSPQFSNAVATIGRMDRLTMIVAASRRSRGERRYENYAVSGAFVPRSVYPSDFDRFTHRFHYSEAADADVARAVLLRYDADAYRVKTVLANSIDVNARVEKGELFDSSQPYVFADGALTASSDHFHIEDICDTARSAVATSTPALGTSLTRCVSALAGLGTARFLAFLDSGIVPQPTEGSTPHLAGTRHGGGDLACRCWKHRTCVDLLTEPDGVAPLAALLRALAVLDVAGCAPKPRLDRSRRTNVDIQVGGSTASATLIYPFGLSFETLQEKLFGERPPVLDVHVLIVAELSRDRPSVESINVATASGPSFDPSKGAGPTLSALRLSDLTAAASAGGVPELLQRLFGRSAA